jgi:hypothetical protein
MRDPAVETGQALSSSPLPHNLRAATIGAGNWLTTRLTPNGLSQLTRVRLFVISATILVTAMGVRLLYWQDSAVAMSAEDTLSLNMARQYRREARRILDEGRILFPRQQTDPGNAMMIVHPPGYSMVMALSFKLLGETEGPLRWLQIICDAAEAVLVFAIAVELLPVGLAVTAATLMALSPHASYYSLRLSPDSLAVLPVLFAVYLLIRAIKRPRLLTIILAGLMLGLSCWLRANALLLAPFLALALTILLKRRKRLLHASLLVAATFLVISPITIRNWVVYHRFIPISLPTGVNLIQGIAEFDKEGRFGMPLSDPDVLKKDVEWNNRPDYGGHMWTPDGIDRDRTRFARGIDVVRSHPLWYLGAMLRRAFFMLSYNESRPRDWPFNTATVPLVSATPPFGHSLSIIADKSPARSFAPGDMISGSTLSPLAQVSASANGETFQISGGGSEYETQFVSAPISVQRDSDYVLTLPARLIQGQAAAKVIGADERVVLASAVIGAGEESPGEGGKRHPGENGENTPTMIPFASGNAGEIHLVLSNNGDALVGPIVDIGKVDLFEAGPTPTLWTHYPRLIVRAIERNIFKTERLLPLVIAGVGLLGLARRDRVLLILLAVPVYYVSSHAPFSTEYRYILAVHCFLFVLGSVTLYCAGASIGRAASHLRKNPAVETSDGGL